MWTALITVPVQIMCQLIIPGNNGTGETAIALDTQLQEGNDLVLPNFSLKMPNSGMRLPKGYIPFPDIGVAYKYYTDEMTWNEARKACIADGATLAEIDTFEEIQRAMDLKKENVKHGLFVGIHRLFDSTEWSSLKTGLQLTMLPWGSVSNDESERFKCMVMYYDGRGLTADDCTVTYRFMCEIDLEEPETAQIS